MTLQIMASVAGAVNRATGFKDHHYSVFSDGSSCLMNYYGEIVFFCLVGQDIRDAACAWFFE